VAFCKTKTVAFTGLEEFYDPRRLNRRMWACGNGGPVKTTGNSYLVNQVQFRVSVVQQKNWRKRFLNRKKFCTHVVASAFGVPEGIARKPFFGAKTAGSQFFCCKY